MGIEINSTEFTAQDRRRFSERMEQQLDTLESMLGTPGFGVGERTVGSELELYIVDDDGAAPCMKIRHCWTQLTTGS